MFDLLFAGSLGGFYGVSMCARVRARVCVCPLCACLWVGGCSILGCLYGTGSLHAYVARLRSLGSKPLCGGFAERILQWKWLGWVKIKAGCSPPPPQGNTCKTSKCCMKGAHSGWNCHQNRFRPVRVRQALGPASRAPGDFVLPDGKNADRWMVGSSSPTSEKKYTDPTIVGHFPVNFA